MRALWLVAGLLGVLGMQAFHHHSAHDGGLFNLHDDCAFCARVGGPTEGTAVPLAASSAPIFAVEHFFSSLLKPLFSRPFLQPFGRAPPSFLGC